jgi:hypothetical protein
MNEAQAWRDLAVHTYDEASKIEHASPGSLVAVELYARAGAEAAIATAFATCGSLHTAEPSKRKAIDKATTTVVSHTKS